MLNDFAGRCYAPASIPDVGRSVARRQVQVGHAAQQVAFLVRSSCCGTRRNSAPGFAPPVACRATDDRPARPCPAGRRAGCGNAGTGLRAWRCCSGVMCSNVSIRFRICCLFLRRLAVEIAQTVQQLVLLLRRKAAEAGVLFELLLLLSRRQAFRTCEANRHDVGPDPGGGTDSCCRRAANRCRRFRAFASRRGIRWAVGRRRCRSVFCHPGKRASAGIALKHQHQHSQNGFGRRARLLLTPWRIVRQERRTPKTNRRSCPDTAGR